MTNAQIIFNAEQALAEQGIINYTGRIFEAVDVDGNKMTLKETEEIHTFAAWKEMGYQVQKGSKAVVKLNIWKCITKKNPKTEEVTNKMIMKTAFFFSASQVAKIA